MVMVMCLVLTSIAIIQNTQIYVNFGGLLGITMDFFGS
jgi:hypothetical protein